MENNKLIAEFMGIEEAYNPNGNDWVLKKTTPDINGDTDILECCKNNDLKYHESWDWLMPVVDKLEGIETDYGYYEFRIQLGETKIVDDRFETWIEINEGERFENTYLAVVEFIKSFNKNK